MDIEQSYEAYQHIKQRISTAQNYLLVGVDVAKHKQYACFMLSSGEAVLRSCSFENNRAGFESFLKKLRDHESALKPERLVVGLETTGNYALPLAHFLQRNNILCVAVSSLVTKRNRDTLDLS